MTQPMVTTVSVVQRPSQPTFTAEERSAVTKLVRSLRPDSPVRQIAEDILDGKPVFSLEPLLAVLRCNVRGRWTERAVAAWAIGLAARPDDKAIVVPVLCVALDCRRAKGLVQIGLLLSWRLWFCGSLLIACFLLFMFPFSLCMDDCFGSASGYRSDLLTGLGISLYIAGITRASIMKGRRRDTLQLFAAKSLGRVPCSSSIPVLYRESRPFTGEVAEMESSLRIVLSSLTSEDYGLLNTDVMPVLCKMLLGGTSVPTLEIFDALRHVGDGQAVRAVETAAKYGQTPKIQNAAEELIPILIKRRDAENAPGVLLRASQKDTTSAHELLRSTIDDSRAPPDDLLRPTAGD